MGTSCDYFDAIWEDDGIGLCHNCHEKKMREEYELFA